MRKFILLLCIISFVFSFSDTKAIQIQPFNTNYIHDNSDDSILNEINIQTKSGNDWEEDERISYIYSLDGKQVIEDSWRKIDGEFIQNSITTTTYNDEGFKLNIHIVDESGMSSFNQHFYYNDDFSHIDSIKYVMVEPHETYLEKVIFEKITDDSLSIHIEYEYPEEDEKGYINSSYALIEDGNYIEYHTYTQHKTRNTYYDISLVKLLQINLLADYRSSHLEFIAIEMQSDRLYLGESDWVPHKRVLLENNELKVEAIVKQDFDHVINNWVDDERLDITYQDSKIIEQVSTVFNTEGFIEEKKSIYTYEAATNTEDEIVISEFELTQNYPNPFNPTTNISFTIPELSEVNLKVFNVSGQEVVTLVSGIRSAGTHTVQFKANSLSSGVYYYQLRIGEKVQTKAMMLIK